MRNSLLTPYHDDDDDTSAPPPRRPGALTRSHASARLPSVEDLAGAHLKPTPHHCLPPSDLHDCIARVHPKGVVRERQWRTIQLRCQTHADEATRLDRRGRSCLHAVCAKKPPLTVVKALVQASEAQVLVKGDNHGRTPLAIAISSNASLDIIEFLLDTEPRAASVQDHLDRLPLHLACIGYDYGQLELVRLLIAVNSQACRHESRNGRTPLHLAIEGGASVHVIQLLTKTFPEAVEMAACGMSPLNCAIRQMASVQVIQTLVRARPEATKSRDHAGAFPLRRAMEIHCSTAVLTCLCTSPEIVMDTDDHMNNTALHAAFERGNGIPRESMVRLMVTTAPKVATLACRSGHTPLTLACRKYVHLATNEESAHAKTMWNIVSLLLRVAMYHSVHPNVAALLDSNDFCVHAALSTVLPRRVVMAALERYPDQALVPDFNGNYPLYLALTSPYEESKSHVVVKLLEQCPEAATFLTPDHRTMLSVATMAKSIDGRAIAALLRANPAALRQRDPRLGLYPFQLEALEKSLRLPVPNLNPRIQREWDIAVNQDLMQVSVIYQLLLAAPELVEAQGG